MTSTALKSMLKEQPFRPFNIILSSGDRFPVRHPEVMLVLRDRVVIAVEPATAGEDPDDYNIISFLHIAATEPLADQPKWRPKAS